MKNDLISKLDAILFYLAEPVSVDFLAKTLGVPKKTVFSAVGELGLSMNARGVRIVYHDDEVTLVTAPEFSETIEQIIREERERDFGRAGIETLSIVAYKGPVSKKEIEYIRGVNSQFVLRNLLLRGLVERKNSKSDERVILYNITGDTLRHLGLSHISELPEYEEMKKQLEVPKETEEEKVEVGESTLEEAE